MSVEPGCRAFSNLYSIDKSKDRGKNFHEDANKLISGQELFLLAMQDIIDAHHSVGGRIVVVECKNDDKLRKFYEETLGFQLIDTADDESMLK